MLAWWSLIHVPDDELPTVFGHFHGALRPGGPPQVGFHVSDESRLKTQSYGGRLLLGSDENQAVLSRIADQPTDTALGDPG